VGSTPTAGTIPSRLRPTAGRPADYREIGVDPRLRRSEAEALLLADARRPSPRAWTKVDEVFPAARLPRKQEDRVRFPASAPSWPASWCGHSARLKTERTWFDPTAGHHPPSTLGSVAALYAARGSSSLPDGSSRGYAVTVSPAALQVVSLGSNPSAPATLTSSKWRGCDPPKVAMAVRVSP
jgi:hypothetical protein